VRKRVAVVLLVVVLVLVAVGLDQIAKGLARGHLSDGRTVFVAGRVLVLRYVENPGAFLELGSRLPYPVRRVALIAIPLVILGWVVGYLASRRDTGMAAVIGLSLVAGGGLGNLVDRLGASGRVSDFINVGIGTMRTGIFNLADLFIMSGCVVLLIVELSRRRETAGRRGESEP